MLRHSITISAPVHNCVVLGKGQLIRHWNHGGCVALRLSKHTGWVEIIGGFRYAITLVGSVARSWNSCRLHTVNISIWHKEVREYLNKHLPGRWFGRAAARDNIFCTWPPRPPDLTVFNFFLWDFAKDNVCVPPLPKTLPELREPIDTVIGNVTHDMLGRVWREWEYRLDICRWGAYRMHLRSLWNCRHSSFKW